MLHKWISAFLLLVCITSSHAATSAQPAAKNYADHCAECHGVDRLGGVGSALLPGNLERLRRADAATTISQGRSATQMPGFADKLSPSEIQALVDYIYQPLPYIPVWRETEITSSFSWLVKPETLANKPQFDADPLNLFIVVELADHHATLLDGDKFEPITRFSTHRALHGGPKFSPDGRYVYFASRDGWISKFDIYNLQMIAEIRVGINTRNLAVSGDGKTLIIGNYLPHTLVLLNAEDLSLIKVLPVVASEGKSSRVSAVYQAEPRGSFIAALKDAKEVWEINYTQPDFPLRRIVVDDYLDDFFFDPTYQHLMGSARDNKKGWVLDLNEGKRIAEVSLPGMPHLASGIVWEYQGKTVMATPNLKEALVSIIDMSNWQTIKQIPTAGSGFFMRSHENSRYAWTDGFNSKDQRDAMFIIDKTTLELVKTLRPFPGKTAAHVEFTRDGKYALISIWEDDGALIIYDAETLTEVKRLAMKKPSGKYNVYNKITRSTGTSH